MHEAHEPLAFVFDHTPLLREIWASLNEEFIPLFNVISFFGSIPFRKTSSISSSIILSSLRQLPVVLLQVPAHNMLHDRYPLSPLLPQTQTLPHLASSVPCSADGTSSNFIQNVRAYTHPCLIHLEYSDSVSSDSQLATFFKSFMPSGSAAMLHPPVHSGLFQDFSNHLWFRHVEGGHDIHARQSTSSLFFFNMFEVLRTRFTHRGRMGHRQVLVNSLSPSLRVCFPAAPVANLSPVLEGHNSLAVQLPRAAVSTSFGSIVSFSCTTTQLRHHRHVSNCSKASNTVNRRRVGVPPENQSHDLPRNRRFAHSSESALKTCRDFVDRLTGQLLQNLLDINVLRPDNLL